MRLASSRQAPSTDRRRQNETGSGKTGGFAGLPTALRGIPGVMGYYDYFTNSMMTFWGSAAGPFALLIGFSLGVTALLTLRPGYK